MKHPKIHLLLSSLLLLAAGCATTPNVTRVEAGGPTAVTTMGVNVQDFKNAAGQMVSTLLNSGALDKVSGRKAVILVGKIVNDSGEMFDTDQITFKITTDLMNSGKTQTTTTFGKNAQDKIAGGVADERRFLQDDKGQGLLPDFSLSGKILRTDARAGRTREVSYTFQLYLTDTASGLAVWQNETVVSKQGTRPGVGF